MIDDAFDFDVLLVDDEPVILDAASKILADEGLGCDRSGDLGNAMQKVKTRRYRVALCDLLIPGVSGWDLVRSIRDEQPGSPVIAISGYATLVNSLAGFSHGVFDFIPKPFDCGELLGVVLRALDFARVGDTPHEPASCEDASHEVFALGQHSWVRLSPEGSARIGMGQTYASLTDAYEKAELPSDGDVLVQGNSCARWMTEGRLAHRLWAPLSGRVLNAHREQFVDPTWRGGGPGEPWGIDMIPANPESELATLTRRQEA